MIVTVCEKIDLIQKEKNYLVSVIQIFIKTVDIRTSWWKNTKRNKRPWNNGFTIVSMMTIRNRSSWMIRLEWRNRIWPWTCWTSYSWQFFVLQNRLEKIISTWKLSEKRDLIKINIFWNKCKIQISIQSEHKLDKFSSHLDITT